MRWKSAKTLGARHPGSPATRSRVLTAGPARLQGQRALLPQFERPCESETAARRFLFGAGARSPRLHSTSRTHFFSGCRSRRYRRGRNPDPDLARQKGRSSSLLDRQASGARGTAGSGGNSGAPLSFRQSACMAKFAASPSRHCHTGSNNTGGYTALTPPAKMVSIPVAVRSWRKPFASRPAVIPLILSSTTTDLPLTQVEHCSKRRRMSAFGSAA